jgi:recombinational DNA repair ATPase RecF
MENQNAYQQKMAAQMKVWSAQIDLLDAKMENVGADIKLRRLEEIQALRAKQLAASEKMRELGRSTGEAWQQVKLTADKLWDDLKTGIGQAQAKFK